jgi:hypothetical protein
MGQKMGHFRASEGRRAHSRRRWRDIAWTPAYSRIGAPGCLPSVGCKAAAGMTLASTHGTGVVPKVRLRVTPLPYHRRRGRE